MNPDVKSLWTSALRSDQYRQGYRRLKDSNGCFCVLGVLCDLHAKAHGNEWKTFSYLGSNHFPPPEVYEWAGVPVGHRFAVPFLNGRINRVYDLYLDTLNDRQVPFSELADLIEKHI